MLHAPRIATFVVFAALATASCGDEGPTPTPTDELLLPPLGAEPATVQVVSPGGALSNAGIVVETNAGQLIELATSRDGTVEMAVPPEGIKSILAHKDGFTFSAISGARFTELLDETGGIQLYLTSTAPTAKTWVAGQALGMSPDHWLTVTADQPASTISQAVGTSYSLQVEKNEPFLLIGVEWMPSLNQPVQGVSQTMYGWTGYASEGIDGASAIDIDFNYSMATETRKGSFHLPAGGDMSDHGRAYVQVTTAASNGNLFLGAATTIDVSHYSQIDLGVDAPPLPAVPERQPEGPVDPWTARSSGLPDAGHSPPFVALGADVLARHHLELPTRALPDDGEVAPERPESAWSEIRDIAFDFPEPGVRAEYEAELAVLPPAYAAKLPGIMTQYVSLLGGSYAFAIEPGPPAAGDSAVALPSMPAIATEPAPSIHEAVYWKRTGRTARLVTVAVVNDRGNTVGTMIALASEREAACPPLPSTSDPDPVFSGELTAIMVTCTPSTEIAGWCARGTQSAPFAVVP